MSYLIVNVDPQLHSMDGKLQKAINRLDNAKVIEKECITEQDVIDFGSNADAILTARAPITKKVIQQLTKCKVIGRFGTGTDNVDHEVATEKGIVVVYVPDFCTEEVANHTLMFILSCHKKMGLLDKSVRRGDWGFNLISPLPALKSQVLGLVGFGRVSQALAKKAMTLGLRIIAYDPYISVDVFNQNHTEKVELTRILKESDYVSLHIPLTKETAGGIGQAQLAMMKPTAYLINCARGAVVDESALIRALQEKRIAGAALDCLTKEPPDKNNPLLDMDNVIFTPHSAAYSDDAIDYLRTKTIEQLVQVLKGVKPQFIRNPDVLDKVKLIRKK